MRTETYVRPRNENKVYRVFHVNYRDRTVLVLTNEDDQYLREYLFEDVDIVKDSQNLTPRV